MPELTNARHEIFARTYANTFKTTRAADAAGYAYATAPRIMAVPEVRERIRELNMAGMTVADVTAERVKLELGRIAFADIRKIFNDRGHLLPVDQIGDDEAAAIAGIEVEVRRELGRKELDLATGEMVPIVTEVRTAKIKRANKDAALGTLAKHFKLVGDEGDGVNALANALADRLKLARKRAEPLEYVHEDPLPGE